MADHDYFTPCAGLAHQHFSWSLWYCQHRQQWTLTTSRFVGAEGDGEVTDHVTRGVAMGPFDSWGDAEDLLLSFVRTDLTTWAGEAPRLPGS